MYTQQRQASNYWLSFRSCPTKVIPSRGCRFAPACCAAQSVLRRGPGCAMPFHLLAWAALNLHRRSELHQTSASAGPMKAVHASFAFGFRWPKQCGLTIRSTGPIAAGRHLGYKSLAQIPAHRNRPVSSNVRPFNLNAPVDPQDLSNGAYPDEYFSPSWTPFQADRGRDFSVIVDGVSD